MVWPQRLVATSNICSKKHGGSCEKISLFEWNSPSKNILAGHFLNFWWLLSQVVQFEVSGGNSRRNNICSRFSYRYWFIHSSVLVSSISTISGSSITFQTICCCCKACKSCRRVRRRWNKPYLTPNRVISGAPSTILERQHYWILVIPTFAVMKKSARIEKIEVNWMALKQSLYGFF